MFESIDIADISKNLQNDIFKGLTPTKTRSISVTCDDPIVPRFNTSSGSHNTTIKTNEIFQICFIAVFGESSNIPDIKKSFFMIYKKRTKGYFVFDFYKPTERLIKKIKQNTAFGEEIIPSMIETVLTDLFSFKDHLAFISKYLK